MSGFTPVLSTRIVLEIFFPWPSDLFLQAEEIKPGFWLSNSYWIAKVRGRIDCTLQRLIPVNPRQNSFKTAISHYYLVQYWRLRHVHSLRSRRLEVACERENGRTRGRHARGVSPSRAPVFSCAHYFQAPATQATMYITPQPSYGGTTCHSNFVKICEQNALMLAIRLHLFGRRFIYLFLRI